MIFLAQPFAPIAIGVFLLAWLFYANGVSSISLYRAMKGDTHRITPILAWLGFVPSVLLSGVFLWKGTASWFFPWLFLIGIPLFTSGSTLFLLFQRAAGRR